MALLRHQHPYLGLTGGRYSSCVADPVPVLWGSAGLLTAVCSPRHSLPCCASSETLPVEYMGGKPLCMNQYYQILSSCRIPGPKRDSIVNYAKGKKQSRHITVVHNFQVWQLLGSQGLFECTCPSQQAVPLEKSKQKVSAHRVCLTRDAFQLPLSSLALAGQQLGLPHVSKG